MTDHPTITAARALRLIREKKAQGEYHVTGWLDLRGCDLSGVTLPSSVTGSLDLRGCDLSGVTLPSSVTGSLDLSGCDLSGVTLPSSVGGWLYLSGCDLSGVTLPSSVTGSLDLRGCDLSGVTLPSSVTGWLDLSGARNPESSQWWAERGEATRRRCIAISEYALVQTDTDRFFAGCRAFTRKQALKHWGEHRTDARAVAFRAAIRECVL